MRQSTAFRLFNKAKTRRLSQLLNHRANSEFGEGRITNLLFGGQALRVFEPVKQFLHRMAILQIGEGEVRPQCLKRKQRLPDRTPALMAPRFCGSDNPKWGRSFPTHWVAAPP